MKTKDENSKDREISKMLMKKDKEFEQWWKKIFCDKQGNPIVFIPIYRTTQDFKNYCKLAWEEAKKRCQK